MLVFVKKGDFMFETSRDLLFVVLSLCIVWFSVFLCWLLYQAGRVLKNINDIVESTTQKLEMITDAVYFIRDKVDNLSGKMGVISTLMTGMVEKFVVNKISDTLDSRVSKKNKKKTNKK